MSDVLKEMWVVGDEEPGEKIYCIETIKGKILIWHATKEVVERIVMLHNKDIGLHDMVNNDK